MTTIIPIGVHIVCCCRRSVARKKEDAVGRQKFEVGDGSRSFLESFASRLQTGTGTPSRREFVTARPLPGQSSTLWMQFRPFIIFSDPISSFTTTVPHLSYVALDSGDIHLGCAYADRGHRLLAWSSQRHRQVPLSGSIGALPLLTVIDGTTRHFWSLVMM